MIYCTPDEMLELSYVDYFQQTFSVCYHQWPKTILDFRSLKDSLYHYEIDEVNVAPGVR